MNGLDGLFSRQKNEENRSKVRKSNICIKVKMSVHDLRYRKRKNKTIEKFDQFDV